MTEYAAPLRDMRFVLEELVGLDTVSGLPGCEDVTPELVNSILEENAKFAAEVLSPLNQIGDTQGLAWEKGNVRTPAGFREAYRQFVEAGWNALQFPPNMGGQGLPRLVATPVAEMWKSANLSFSHCPHLTAGAIEALILHGSKEQQQRFLPNMVKGVWSGTMNLTEPQAGTDLALLRTRGDRATDAGDIAKWGEHYRLRGQKIFITYGEHDLTENIVHLVLARAAGAPEGVRGISLFLVPKFLVNADGSIGPRNDIYCASIEHKMGIRASPTTVLMYGSGSAPSEVGEGAVGYLIGEENQGLSYMFVMMNAARLGVGMEGLGVAQRAYQRALAYAKERIQSRDLTGGKQSVTIIHQPDVRRMLMTMKAQTEAARAFACEVAAWLDNAERHPDAAERKKYQALADFMIPVVKGWITEMGIEVASTGIQVHGGMGFIEETGAAQYLRDARITAIYEGTTAIQSNDLVGRKTAREGGATARAMAQMMQATVNELKTAEAKAGAARAEDLAAIRTALAEGIAAFSQCAEWITANYERDIKAVYAGSVPYLMLTGIVAGGWLMARAALVADRKLAEGSAEQDFYGAKLGTARFYADHIMSRTLGLSRSILTGAKGVMALAEGQF